MRRGGLTVVADHRADFDVACHDEDGRHVLAVRGELDLDTAATLRAALHAAVAAGHTDLVVDLAGMGFIDSSGISVLVEGTKHVQRAAGRLVVRNATPGARRVLEIAGLLEFFGMLDEPPPP